MRTGVWGGIALLATLGGCGEDGGSGTEIVGRECSTVGAVACAKLNPSDEEVKYVAVCEDDGWAQLVLCPERETCIDSDIDGAVACTEINTFVPYGERDGPCSGDKRVCDETRDTIYTCADGAWDFDEDCEAELLTCTVPNGTQDVVCTDEVPQ